MSATAATNAVAPEHADAVLDTDTRPFFLITIDTEGDHLWSRPTQIATRNAGSLPRFQELCERYALKPTYLTNYEMAMAPAFQEFGREVLARGSAEIGMHLHAWNSPPLVPLTADDYRYQPYLAEYPEPLIREKVRFMTDLLESTFGVKMRSHRAGRWRMSSAIARVLVECGYEVDCSVTPHVSWKRKLGDPAGEGGSDYTLYPQAAYFVDLDDLSREGRSSLLEVPVTILSGRRPLARLLPARLRSSRIVQKLLQHAFPADWLTPTPWNAARMTTILPRALHQRRRYVEFALHSSELMPGGSPNFRNEAEIETLYERLQALFETASGHFRGATLSEYRREFSVTDAR